MSLNGFRQLAAKMDQQMQQLSDQGVNDAYAIINRMMAYVPDLHKIWVGTSDDQLAALSNEFPGFYRYAIMMEEASKIELNKASRPYDGMAQFSEQHKQQATQLLVTAATLERSYQEFFGNNNLQAVQPQVEIDKLHRQWLYDLESFKKSLCTQGVKSKALEYVNEAFGHLIERIKKLAG